MNWECPMCHEHLIDTLVGTCQVETKGEKRSFNAGNVNANLQYNDGILFLNYTGGDKCHNNQFERNTIISFICSSGTGHGQPEFIAETGDCTYQFVWHTELACEEQVRRLSNGTSVLHCICCCTLSIALLPQFTASSFLLPASIFFRTPILFTSLGQRVHEL